MFAVLAAVFACGAVGGCHTWPDFSGFQYVRDKGNSRDITKWALKQHDPNHVDAAQVVLGSTLREELSVDAFDGLSQIHKKLTEDWEDLDGGMAARVWLMRRTIGAFANVANVMPVAKEAFYRIRPEESQTVLLEDWKRWAEFVEAGGVQR